MNKFIPLGESVPATINRMLTEAQLQTDTNPDYRILVTDEAGNQTTYADFETAMQAVAWGNIRVAISRLRDQIEAIGRAMAHVDFSGLDWLRSQYNQRLSVHDQPPPRHSHHTHLIQQHIRSARKPAKHARNSRQIMVAAIPLRQTRRHKRKTKKME